MWKKICYLTTKEQAPLLDDLAFIVKGISIPIIIIEI